MLATGKQKTLRLPVRDGQIWPLQAWRRLVAGHARAQCQLVRILNAAPVAPFSAVAFSTSNSYSNSYLNSTSTSYYLGFLLAVADERGVLHVLDSVRNRVWMLVRTGVSVSALAFSARELVVCCVDTVVRVYSIGK